MGADITNNRHSPHPVPLPMGEGTPPQRLRGSLPAASACGCGHAGRKLAKASLRGEGWGEGRDACSSCPPEGYFARFQMCDLQRKPQM